MQVQELSTEELSRLLAEHFEPKPQTRLADRFLSELGWWLRRRYDSGGRWEARKYTDPEICVRLLKWLLDDGFVMSRSSKGTERAIAEAALLLTGWKG